MKVKNCILCTKCVPVACNDMYQYWSEVNYTCTKTVSTSTSYLSTLHLHTHTHALRTHIHCTTHTHTHTHTWTHTHTHIHTHTHTHTHTLTYTHTHTHIHTHTHMHTYTLIHTCTHTHSHTHGCLRQPCGFFYCSTCAAILLTDPKIRIPSLVSSAHNELIFISFSLNKTSPKYMTWSKVKVQRGHNSTRWQWIQPWIWYSSAWNHS